MILRVTYPNGSQNFIDIGNHFSLVMRDAGEEFEKLCDTQWGVNDDQMKPHCEGFLLHHRGSEVEPIYQKQKNVVLVFGNDRFDVIDIYRDWCLPLMLKLNSN